MLPRLKQVGERSIGRSRALVLATICSDLLMRCIQTFRDPESLEDVPLVPGLNKLDNMLRWGFIKKVYGIISAQMILTVIVASVINFNEPVQNFVTSSAPFQISVFASSFLGKPSSAG